MGVQGSAAARAPGAELSAPRAQGFRIWRLSHSGGHLGRRQPRLYAYDGGALAGARKVRPDALFARSRARAAQICVGALRRRRAYVPRAALRLHAGEDILPPRHHDRSEEHTSELQSLMRISYAVFCLKKNTKKTQKQNQEY